MRGKQRLTLVWVDTSKESWTESDKQLAREQAAFSTHWWETLVSVSFSVQEQTLVVPLNVLAFDVCHNRSWLPASEGKTIYMLAVTPTYNPLVCDSIVVLDYTQDDGRAIYWGYVGEGNSFREGLAHTLGHLYGARDGPSKDIMDKDTLYEAYQNHTVADTTIQSIGALKK